jgi:hypothetical protein
MQITIESSGSCSPQKNNWATFKAYAAVGLAVSFMVVEPVLSHRKDEFAEPHTVEMAEKYQPVSMAVQTSGTHALTGTGSLALSSSLD